MKKEPATGYEHSRYAASLAEYGTPRSLPRSNGWILERQIPGLADHDGIGCYPLFCCADWTTLGSDLDELGGDLVSLCLVADPFGEYDPEKLRKWFPDIMLPFKKHFVVDLTRSPDSFVAENHRRNARKARQVVEVAACAEPSLFAEDWITLYQTLVCRHSIRGFAAFSREAFEMQLTVPGIVALRAVSQGETVGMTLWYVQGDVGYYHLGAYSERGYSLRSSFALFWFAIEYFTQRGLTWLNLGGAAGVNPSDGDGLARFKRGWATGDRAAFLCGRIFDADRYSQILRAKGIVSPHFFPAYRQGEIE